MKYAVIGIIMVVVVSAVVIFLVKLKTKSVDTYRAIRRYCYKIKNQK